jgi:hypothetical protein
VTGHDADGLVVMSASLDHLDVVDPRQLGVDLSGHVGRHNQLIP